MRILSNLVLTVILPFDAGVWASDSAVKKFDK